MKHLPFIVFMLLFFGGMIALVNQLPSASSKAGESQAASAPRPLSALDCTTRKTVLLRHIEEANGCWDDSECFASRLGYPWQHAPCDYQLFSRSEKTANASLQPKLLEYMQACVIADEAQKQAWQEYERKAALASCEPLSHIKLVCISGKCANQTQALLQFDDEGVDIYGSRGHIDMPE